LIWADISGIAAFGAAWKIAETFNLFAKSYVVDVG